MNVDELHKEIIKPEFAEIKADIKEVLLILRGNGKEGIVTTVARQGDSINNIKKAIWLVIGILGTVVSKFLWTLFVGIK